MLNQMMCPNCGTVIAIHAVLKGKQLTVDENGEASTEIQCPVCSEKIMVGITFNFNLGHVVSVNQLIDPEMIPDGYDFNYQATQEIMDVIIGRIIEEGKGYTKEQFKTVTKQRYKTHGRFKHHDLETEIDIMINAMYEKWWFFKDKE